MSHSISVIIAHENHLSGVARELGGAAMHAAAQQMALIPVNGPLVEKLGPLAPSREGTFKWLTPSLEEHLAQWSRTGPLLYAETEYFGGLGRQASILFKDGSVVLGPLMHDTTPGMNGPRTPVKDLPINTALRMLGVVAKGSMDEFDTVGLGTVRSNQDWA